MLKFEVSLFVLLILFSELINIKMMFWTSVAFVKLHITICN